jgi:hypothetical protein
MNTPPDDTAERTIQVDTAPSYGFAGVAMALFAAAIGLLMSL